MKPPIKSGERKQWIENISLMFKKEKSIIFNLFYELNIVECIRNVQVLGICCHFQLVFFYIV